MRKFIQYSFLLLLLTVIISYGLDRLYTYGFTTSKKMTRFGFLHSKHDQHFDYVFLGSSRVVNTIDPQVFDDKLKANTVNFGIMDARPKDIWTLRKLLAEYHITYDTLVAQVDYYYNDDKKRSNFLYFDMLPFLGSNEVINTYYQSEKDSWKLTYLPFYKYAANDSKLGLHSLIYTRIKPDTSILESKGYEPLYGSSGTWQRILPDTLAKQNRYMAALVNKTDNLVLFTAPFRPDTRNLSFVDSLQLKYPELLNFSKAIQNEELFKNGYHLNDKGAKEFSQLFANKLSKSN